MRIGILIFLILTVNIGLPQTGKANPLSHFLNQEDGYSDQVLEKNTPWRNPNHPDYELYQEHFLHGKNKNSYERAVDYVALMFCVTAAGSAFVKNKMTIRTEEQAKKWLNKRGIIAAFRSSNFKPRVGPLSKAAKGYNFVIKLWTGTTMAFSSGVCLIHLNDRAIDLILTNPRSAYNQNEAFRKFVQEQGWEPAIDALKAWRGKSSAQRFDTLKYQVRKLRPATGSDPLEENDFFEDGETEKVN